MPKSSRLDVLARCLQEAVSGPYFPEWEFHTPIGPSRAEVEHAQLEAAFDCHLAEVANIAAWRGEQQFDLEAPGYSDRSENA